MRIIKVLVAIAVLSIAPALANAAPNAMQTVNSQSFEYQAGG